MFSSIFSRLWIFSFQLRCSCFSFALIFLLWSWTLTYDLDLRIWLPLRGEDPVWVIVGEESPEESESWGRNSTDQLLYSHTSPPHRRYRLWMSSSTRHCCTKWRELYTIPHATGYLMCVRKLTDTQLNLPHGTKNKQKKIRKRTKNKKNENGRQLKLDGCILWNAHNTVFRSKRMASCVLAIYFVHSTRPKIQGLVSRDSIVDCHCLSQRYVPCRQPACGLTDVAENLVGEISCTECTGQGMTVQKRTIRIIHTTPVECRIHLCYFMQPEFVGFL